MRKHLAVTIVAVTAAATLAVVASTLVRRVSNSEWPRVRAQWPPEGLTLPAMRSAPPPPPPLPCECFGYFDEDSQGEDLGNSPEALPVVRLADASDGQAPPLTKPVAAARVSQLPDSEASRLLTSLPPLPRDEAAPIEGSSGDASLQSPPAGAERAAPLTAQEEGPPPPTPAPAQLLVLRTSPRGDIAVAPQLAALFSEPMTALGHPTPDLPPVDLTPSVPGQWRWLGSRLLVFLPNGRFPMATEFVARIPAGQRALSGSTLDHPVEWRFATPPVSLVDHYPTTGPIRRDTIFFVGFDQVVDPRAVLASIRVDAGGTRHQLRLATEEEISRDSSLRRLVRESVAGRWLAFRAAGLLPGASRIRVSVGPGVPSLEGPRRATTQANWTLETYGPLVVRQAACDAWGSQRGCVPGKPWRLEFSNPIDHGSFREDMVRVEPPIDGLSVSARGDSICVRGLPRPRTTYRLAVAAGVRDRFGGLLGHERTFTFQTGDFEPLLIPPREDHFVLDPADGTHLTVHSAALTHLHVEIRTVSPEDWSQFEAHRSDPGKLPGRVVCDWVERPVSPDGGLVATPIDLGPALRGGVGQVLVSVDGHGEREPAERWPPNAFVTWVQVTKIGIDASWDGRHVLVRTTSLANAQPLGGVVVRVARGGTELRTDKNGVADVPMSTGPLFVQARLGADEAFLAIPETTADGRIADDGLRFHVMDDRGLYHPGEEVHIKGWARRVVGYPLRRLLPAGLDAVAYRLVDAARSEVAKGGAPINGYGSFEITIPLPKEMSVGPAWLELRRPGGATSSSPAQVHWLRVEEFRRPEVEVRLDPDPAPHFANGTVRIAASARAFDGSPLEGAEIRWRVAPRPGDFVPSGWDGFSFSPSPDVDGAAGARNETWTGLTNSLGSHALAITPIHTDRARPWLLDVTATAQDVDRQIVSASSSVLVHPAELCVGLRNDRTFVSVGDPLALSAVVTDLDGKAVPGRDVHLSISRLSEDLWARSGGDHGVTVGDGRVTSGTGAVAVKLKPLHRGRYRVTATVLDDRGRPAEADVEAWVVGLTDGELDFADGGEPKPLRLAADRSEYDPGGAVRLSVIAPFEGGEGLLTLRQEGVVSTQPFHASAAATTVTFTVARDWVPGVEAQVDISGPGRKFASGRLYLPIPPHDRRLAVEVTPQDLAVPPGGRTLLKFAVADHEGASLASAEVAVVVVDEAVLAVLGHPFGDPLETFFAHVSPSLSARYSRTDIRPGGLSARQAAIEAALVLSEGLGIVGGVVGGIPGGVDGSALPVALRSDMRPLALFAGSLITDALGRTEVAVTLPESLTRFRVFAVASDGKTRFGTGESSITTRLPLAVVPSPPRFLAPGDTAELPVVLRNETDRALGVDVALRGTRTHLLSGGGRHLELAAHGHAEARFPLVADAEGDAQFQVVARAEGLKDAAAFSVPIRAGVAREDAAIYGEVGDRPVVHRIELPTDAVPGSGSLEISTSATDFSTLRDATLSLVSYPYECGEQIASRDLAISTLGDTLGALGIDGVPDPGAQRDRVRRDLLRLRALQQPDGGFTFWGRGPSSPYVSVHVAHALAAARPSYGTLVNPMIDRALPYLRTIESRQRLEDGGVSALVLSAQALYVRRLLGDGDPRKARTIVRANALEKLPIEAIGWLLAALADDAASGAEVSSLRAGLEARVSETAEVAHFVTGYDETDRRVLLASDERVDAMALDALLWAAPTSDLIPKLTAGLLGARRGGRWSTTQANVWAIVALDHAFRSRESALPDFSATAWLGNRAVSTAEFHERAARSHVSVVPFAGPAPAMSEVTLARKGTGLLRYRLGLRYNVDWGRLLPVDRGFSVDRQYEALDDPNDVRQDADGTWHIRAGARVRVRLVLVAPLRHDHVALVSPLPAGLEPLNPSFQTSSPADPVGNGRLWWWDREEIRDDRLQVFATSLDEGIWAFACEAVATTPGRFFAAPPRAEEMYSPEVFGRGAPDRVIVE